MLRFFAEQRKLQVLFVREADEMDQEEGHDGVGKDHIVHDAQKAVVAKGVAVKEQAVGVDHRPGQHQEAQPFHQGEKPPFGVGEGAADAREEGGQGKADEVDEIVLPRAAESVPDQSGGIVGAVKQQHRPQAEPGELR